MQNTSSAHSFRLPAIMALLAACLLALLVAAPPVLAQAKDYSMPQVDIAATVTNEGDVAIAEKRQFSFDGSFTCVWWTFSGLPANASIQVNGVQLQQGPEGAVAAESPHAIEEVPFETSWRSAGGPGGEAWSWDEGETTLYVFFRASDTNLIASIDYTVKDGISAYDDVSELYWKYIADGWAVDSDNVTATVTLPVPAGQTVVPTENTYAWGHGPLNGSVHFNDDGTISYQVDTVSAGQFAEARVLFPTEWLTNLRPAAKEAHQGQTLLATALAQEQEWADAANIQRMQARLFIAFWIAVSLGLIAWAVVMFFRYGKERKPEFTDQYWRDIPDQDLSPAVIGRLMEWNSQDSSQFTATLMGLSAKGVLRIDKGQYQGKRGKMVEDYYLTLLPEVLDLVPVDTLEQKAINLVFGEIAKGENQLWLKSIELYGKEHPESFAKKMESWQGVLTSEVAKAKLFEPKSSSLQGTMRLVAIAYITVAGVIMWFAENLWVLLPVLPASAVLLVIAHFMSKRTRRGAEVAAKADALKKWLKDFTRLNERPPTDVKVWGQFMVYAFLFGIADQVVKDLRMYVPTFQNMSDDAFYGSMPYYYWYSSDMGAGRAIAASVFDATLSNTISTAVAAISESSDGGGGGGGFSGGGGGGFGGGGGAR